MRALLLAASLLVSAPAFAQTVISNASGATPAAKPTIPWSTVMKTEEGKPYIDHCDILPTAEKPDGSGCVQLTLRRAAAHALYTAGAADKPDADTSFARGMLAHQIETDPPGMLDTEQSATLKRLMGGLYPPIIIVQAFPLLFPNDKPGAIK